MIGDAVDNIPGIKGIGPKTAAALLQEFGSLENILENVDKLKGKLKESFKELDKEQLQRMKEIIKLDANIEINIKIEDLKNQNQT
jgi:5''-3'' exonuclease (including N-terminal domain of PolI)